MMKLGIFASNSSPFFAFWLARGGPVLGRKENGRNVARLCLPAACQQAGKEKGEQSARVPAFLGKRKKERQRAFGPRFARPFTVRAKRSRVRLSCSAARLLAPWAESRQRYGRTERTGKNSALKATLFQIAAQHY
jgi:hypothetical protein